MKYFIIPIFFCLISSGFSDIILHNVTPENQKEFGLATKLFEHNETYVLQLSFKKLPTNEVNFQVIKNKKIISRARLGSKKLNGLYQFEVQVSKDYFAYSKITWTQYSQKKGPLPDFVDLKLSDFKDKKLK